MTTAALEQAEKALAEYEREHSDPDGACDGECSRDLAAALRSLLSETQEYAELQSRGIDLIAAERARQVSEEGYDAEHDKGHALEMTEASLSYLASLRYRWRWPDRHDFHPTMWPWALKFWKPTIDPVRQLVKAGALIAAAIDSLSPVPVEEDNR